MSGMKSAYELAMERMGGAAPAMTAGQKAAIAGIDSKMKAKVAEIKEDAEAEKEEVRSPS